MNVRRKVLLGIAVVAALAVAGYQAWSRRSAPPASPPAGAKTQPANDLSAGPTSAHADDDLQSKALVTDQAIRRRQKKNRYIYDPKIHGGTLKGVCCVKYDKTVRLYPPFPIEPAGPNAIKNPAKGEQAYYRARKPLPLVYLGRHARKEKRYGVKGAVVMIRDVQAGSRPDFDRLCYRVDFRTHRIVPAKPQGRDVFNPSACGVGLMLVRQLVQVFNTSLYDCEIVLTDLADGRTVWQESVGRYHDPNFPGDHLGDNPAMARATISQVPRIDRKGFYRLSCRRHPWQEAHLVLWDSPYLTATAGDPDDMKRHPERAGEFVITGIPEGKHTVEVWHPYFEPARKTYQVEIFMDQTTPLTVEFKVPPLLTAKPKPLPKQPVAEWAFVGPFYPLMDEEPDAPNHKLDFAATYEGMESDVAWKRIKASAGRSAGYVELDKVMWKINDLSLSYYAVQIDSPKAQRLTLLVHNESDALKMWLNGATVFKSYTGDFGRGGRCQHPFIVTGDLKAGTNTLLLLVSAERTERERFSVKYLAEGATLKVPVK